jgi:hypothetical protein
MLTAFIAAAVLLGIALLLGWLASRGVPLVRYVALLSCAFGIGAVVMGFVALAAGFTRVYLYGNGLVHARNGRARTVAWPEISELRVMRAGGQGMQTLIAGKTLAYVVTVHNGRKISIQAEASHERNPVGEQLIAVAQHLGRPVAITDARGRPTQR